MTLNIKKNTDLAKLIKLARVILWDEAAMIHRYCLEALDHTLRDIMDVKEPFGGKVVVIGGDYRQVLPVIQHASKPQIIDSVLSSSRLWRDFEIHKLTENMRCASADEATREFVQWLLALGEGKLQKITYNDCTDNITIPKQFLIPGDDLTALIATIYPDVQRSNGDAKYFVNRAILAPTNKVVDEINDTVLDMLPGEKKTYHGTDTVAEDDNALLYPVEFLNTLTLSGLPNHELHLKVGCVVILLRNLNPSAGLANGTRLIITAMYNKVVQAKIITGSRSAGRVVFIPRLRLTPQSNDLPFQLTRTQFPLKLAFCMTINKSQGQSLRHVGLYLPNPVFAHGQLYVACSRVTHPSGLKIMIIRDEEDDAQAYNLTRNVVYTEVLTK